MNTQNDNEPAIDSITYILDTSSVRGLRADDVRLASSRFDVAVSPITVFEFLCHIDERGKKERGLPNDVLSPLHKANLLKCRSLRLLDDPYAEQADDVGARAVVNPTRFEDRLVLPQLFPAIESSTSIEEFYSQQVRYPHGAVADIRDTAERARNLLKEEEKRYRHHVIKWCRLMLKEFGFERSQGFSPEEFVRFAAHAASGLARHYADGLGSLSQEELSGPVFSATYNNTGYGIVRALEYLRKANGDIDRLNVDGNDMEDSAICLHLDLTKHRILVTNDGGTRSALSSALENLRGASESLGTPVVAFTKVMNTEEFKEAVLPADGSSSAY